MFRYASNTSEKKNVSFWKGGMECCTFQDGNTKPCCGHFFFLTPSEPLSSTRDEDHADARHEADSLQVFSHDDEEPHDDGEH